MDKPSARHGIVLGQVFWGVLGGALIPPGFELAIELGGSIHGYRSTSDGPAFAIALGLSLVPVLSLVLPVWISQRSFRNFLSVFNLAAPIGAIPMFCGLYFLNNDEFPWLFVSVLGTCVGLTVSAAKETGDRRGAVRTGLLALVAGASAVTADFILAPENPLIRTAAYMGMSGMVYAGLALGRVWFMKRIERERKWGPEWATRNWLTLFAVAGIGAAGCVLFPLGIEMCPEEEEWYRSTAEAEREFVQEQGMPSTNIIWLITWASRKRVPLSDMESWLGPSKEVDESPGHRYWMFENEEFRMHLYVEISRQDSRVLWAQRRLEWPEGFAMRGEIWSTKRWWKEVKVRDRALVFLGCLAVGAFGAGMFRRKQSEGEKPAPS